MQNSSSVAKYIETNILIYWRQFHPYLYPKLITSIAVKDKNCIGQNDGISVCCKDMDQIYSGTRHWLFTNIWRQSLVTHYALRFRNYSYGNNNVSISLTCWLSLLELIECGSVIHSYTPRLLTTDNPYLPHEDDTRIMSYRYFRYVVLYARSYYIRHDSFHRNTFLKKMQSWNKNLERGRWPHSI